MKELRSLLPQEQDFVRKLAELKGTGKNMNLQNYQTGRVLEQIVGFNFAAIKWDINKQDPITVFYERNEEKDEALSSYFALCDFLYLLEDLENAGLIAIQSASFNEERLLFNRKHYKKEDFENWEFKSEPMGFSYAVPNRGIQTYRIDIVDYLEHFVHLKIIYPRPALFVYVANGFITTEQKRHDEQMKTMENELDNTRRSLRVSKWTLLLSILTILATTGLDIWKAYKPIIIAEPFRISEPIKITDPITIADPIEIHQKEKQLISFDTTSFKIETDTVNHLIYLKTE